VSQEDLIRASYRAWQEDDLDKLIETCDPAIELLPSGSFPDLETIYRGHNGVRDFWNAMRAPWEWFYLDVDRIVEGKDRAAVGVRWRGRGRGSGVMTDLHQGHAMRFKNGRIVEISSHRSFEQALKAVGLSE
jgi:ketosteroid isomerase-like protein